MKRGHSLILLQVIVVLTSEETKKKRIFQALAYSLLGMQYHIDNIISSSY